VLTKDQAFEDITNTKNQQRYNLKHSNSEEDENCAKKKYCFFLVADPTDISFTIFYSGIILWKQFNISIDVGHVERNAFVTVYQSPFSSSSVLPSTIYRVYNTIENKRSTSCCPTKTQQKYTHKISFVLTKNQAFEDITNTKNQQRYNLNGLKMSL
jgi:hypothetical protein